MNIPRRLIVQFEAALYDLVMSVGEDALREKWSLVPVEKRHEVARKVGSEALVEGLRFLAGEDQDAADKFIDAFRAVAAHIQQEKESAHV